MEIRINGKRAALKKGTSFEYVSENRLFSGSEGYSLSITFPLKNCRPNLDIFGPLYRKDADPATLSFDCEIRDRGFVKFGSLAIVAIDQSEVKGQFLEGRSEQNFEKKFEDIYINELQLGRPAVTDPKAITPAMAWDPVSQNFESVALPWWNDSSDGLPHNFAVIKNGSFVWEEFTDELTWQPYLIFIAKKICEAIPGGAYSSDFSKWEEKDSLRYLLCCNTLPGAWGLNSYARALPHWTVEEFFEKLGLFLGGSFYIDHRAKNISFSFNRDSLLGTDAICLDKILDGHSVQISEEDAKCDYLETKNIVYKHDDNEMWKYYSCEWFIKLNKDRAVSYDTLAELLAKNKEYAKWENVDRGRNNRSERLLYAADVDTYFIVRAITVIDEATSKEVNKCFLQPLNVLGGRIVDESEDADEIELEFTPARVDFTEDKYGKVIFLNLSYKDDTNWKWSGTRPGGYDGPIEDDVKQTIIQKRLLQGEEEGKPEYYSCIHVAFWDGASAGAQVQPHPVVEDVEIRDDWSGYSLSPCSLRINGRGTSAHTVVHRIDPRKKTTFKFLADSIPDVLAVFFIHGKRYVCEKLTATFTENGMSQLLKGEFFQIIDH